MRHTVRSLPARERAGWFVLRRPRVLAARKWRVSSREKFTEGRGLVGLGKNAETVVTVPAWNFRALAWVPKGLLQLESAELLVGKVRAPAPKCSGFCSFCGELGPRGGTWRPGKGVAIWAFQVPHALRPVSLLVPFYPLLPWLATLVWFCSRQLISILRSSSSCRSPSAFLYRQRGASALLPCPALRFTFESWLTSQSL